MITDRIVIGSDHAGFNLKEKIIDFLKNKGLEVLDIGTFSEEAVDYPDFAHKLANEIENGHFDYGISICGSGNGINMTANKHQGIRSAICWNEDIARLARYHNDANICSLPARFVDENLAIKLVTIFFETGFEGGRHVERVNKIPIK